MPTAIMPGDPPTARQREVYEFIAAETARRGFAPSFREVAEAFGFTLNAATGHIKALMRKGLIRQERYRSRSLTVVASGPDELTRLRADNERLRAALRLVLDKGRPIAPADPDERTAGVAIHLRMAEWKWAVSCHGGWQEGDPR